MPSHVPDPLEKGPWAASPGFLGVYRGSEMWSRVGAAENGEKTERCLLRTPETVKPISGVFRPRGGFPPGRGEAIFKTIVAGTEARVNSRENESD